MGRPSHTHVWLSGHVLNVGDSVLRRAYADALRRSSGLRVWSGAPESGYEAGLELTDAERSISFARWYWSYVRDVIGMRASFAFNAGEFGVTKSYMTGMTLLLPWIAVSYATGGAVLWLGASVPTRRRGFIWVFDLLARMASPLRWRDIESPTRMGRGETMPDWAFALGPGGVATGSASTPVADLESRTTFTISLRGDRPYPNPTWLAAVTRVADRSTRRPVVVAQTAEDDLFAQRLAEDLDCEVIRWTPGSHRVQEQMIRRAYARSAFTLSDRLHGLIIAATEGSIPLGWTESATNKIATHFDLLGASWVSVSDTGTAVDHVDRIDSQLLAELFTLSAHVVDAARARLDAVTGEISAVLA